MVLDLWVALGHGVPDPVLADDPDHAQVWAELLDEVRGLQAVEQALVRRLASPSE